MIKTRIASAAAVLTFGLAALGGTVVAIAAPANAETGTTSSSGSTSTSGTASTSDKSGHDRAPAENKFEPAKHESFPSAPHSPHEGHGHKGSNEPHSHPFIVKGKIVVEFGTSG